MLDRDPSPALELARLARRAAPRERVDYRIAWVGEEANEDSRQLDGETGWVGLVISFFAPLFILWSVQEKVVVRTLDHVLHIGIREGKSPLVRRHGRPAGDEQCGKITYLVVRFGILAVEPGTLQ
jgi:hypothetical protein